MGELKSTFLIKSSKSKDIGTGFCLYQDDKGSYLVTCSHVVEACGIENLEVDAIQAKLLHQGSTDGIDLALVYVEGLRDATPFSCSFEAKEKGLNFKVEGFKPFKKESYLLRELTGAIETVSTIYQKESRVETYELAISDENFLIERGYSGSAIICENSGEVIAVATDRQQNGKQAYAIPITYLKEIWTDMPKSLLEEVSIEKCNFIHEVFESLDNNPLLLFSTDSYNHADYIETIRDEAIDIFQASHVMEINCGRYGNIKDADKFFSRLAKKMNFEDEVEDSIDFEDAVVAQFEKANPYKTFVLIMGFERLHEDVRNAFAETLRNLQEEHSQKFNLVLFGGEKLIDLKYNTGRHSYFNTFDQKMIPSPSFEEWKEKFNYLTKQGYDEVISVTGGYAKLTEACFKERACTVKEAEKFLDESTWKSELFRVYRKDDLCSLFSKETLGNAHPSSDDEQLYKLYWDNLIVEEKGKFVWRSSFIVDMGKDVLGCK